MRRTSDAYAPGVSVCAGIAPGAERARVDGRGVVGERDALAAGTKTPVRDCPRCFRVLRNRARCGEGLHGVGVWSVEWRWRGEAAGTGTPVGDDPRCHCRAAGIAPCAERASWCGVWCVGMWKCGNVEVWECGVVVEWCGAKQSPSGGLPCPACRSARLPICEPHVHELTTCEKPLSRRQVRSDAVLPSPLYGYVLEQPRSQVGVVILWQGWASESGKAREQKRGRAET